MIIRLKPLPRQAIVIMGATSGIGLLLAHKAAHRGAAVFLIARNEPALARVCEAIKRSGGRAAYAVADVGKEDEVAAAAQAAIANFGAFDTWVNTAGVALYARLTGTPTREHQRLFQTNYWGTVFGCLSAVEHLRRRGGSIITVGSVASDIGSPLLGAYAASKHALKGYIDSLRIELLADKLPIVVTLIKPSGMGTPLADRAASFTGAANRVPPPAYDPELAVDAILHAAAHPRREITVGGIGALQIWGSRLLPSVSDRISSWVGPLLIDKTRPAPATHNLFTPAVDGDERTKHQSMLRHSPYTVAVLNPWLAAFVSVAVAASAVLLTRHVLSKDAVSS